VPEIIPNIKYLIMFYDLVLLIFDVQSNYLIISIPQETVNY